MRGYYVIYSHSQNAWWGNGDVWYKEKEYVTKSLPMGYTISVGTSVGGANASATNYENIVTEPIIKDFYPQSIKRFDTLNDAEQYLLGGSIYVNTAIDFVTIRKIYM